MRNKGERRKEEEKDGRNSRVKKKNPENSEGGNGRKGRGRLKGERRWGREVKRTGVGEVGWWGLWGRGIGRGMGTRGFLIRSIDSEPLDWAAIGKNTRRR